MKKIIHSLIFVLLTYIGSTAQTFIGLVDGNKWTFYCELAINPDEYDTDYYWEQEVKGDTIIEGCTYKKVYNTISGWENESDLGKPSVSLFCQEDNKIYEWSNGNRVLNYDFNLQAGEKFYTAYDIELVVDSVRYKSVPNNESLKHLYVSMSEEQNLNDVWIEGIGSMTDGLNETTMGRVGSGRKLISFISQGEDLLNKTVLETITFGNVWHSYVANIGDNLTFIGADEISIDEHIYYNDVYNKDYYYRQEGKKVYRYTVATQSEDLVIDYGLKANDKFTHIDGSEWIVESLTDTTLVGLEYENLPCLHLRDINNPQNTDVWVEGIGSLHYGINTPVSTAQIGNCYLLSYATADWKAHAFTFSKENVCNKLVEQSDIADDMSNSDTVINVSLKNGNLYVEGRAWYDGAGWWYMLAEEKKGVVYLMHSETVPDADGGNYYPFSVEFNGYNQPSYEVYYNGKYLSTVKQTATDEYIPLVEEGNAWVYLYYGSDGGYYQYLIKEVENIDDIQYHTIYKTFYSGFAGKAFEPTKFGYIRDDNGKVYYATDNNERLIYDFTLQKGDSAYWGQEWYGDIGYDKYVYVKDVNYILIGGKERKVMTVETLGVVFSGDIEYGPDFDETWIEGIGSTETVFASESCRWLTGLTGNYWRFSYFYNYPTQTSYPEGATLYDFSAISTINADTHTLTLHRTGDVLMAVFPTADKGEAITLYDATGRVVAHQAIREGATTASISVATLPQGVYIARLSSGATVKVAL